MNRTAIRSGLALAAVGAGWLTAICLAGAPAVTERHRIAAQVIFNTTKMSSQAPAVGAEQVQRYIAASVDDTGNSLSYDEAVDVAVQGAQPVSLLWDCKIALLSEAEAEDADNDEFPARMKPLHKGQDDETEAHLFYEEQPQAATPAGIVYFRLVRDGALLQMRINRPLAEGANRAIEQAKPRWLFFFHEAERLGLFDASELPDDSNGQPVTEAIVDKALDLFAGELEVAAKARDKTGWLVGEIRPGGQVMSAVQAAELARGAWEQVRQLMQMQTEHKLLDLNDAQKKRIRVLGHWAAWVIERPRYMACYGSEERRNMLHGEIWERPPAADPPTYPLFGPVPGDVPPPPFRVIADESEYRIYEYEYGLAFLQTTVQCADVYFTKGLLWTIYVIYRDRSLSALLSAVAFRVPYAGPVLAFLTTAYTETANFGGLTWDQHVANMCTIVNMSLSAYGRVRVRPTQIGDPSKGVDEGGVPAKVAEALGATGEKVSFRVLRRWEKGPQKFAQLEYAISGKLKGLQGRWDPPVRRQRMVKIVMHEGKERYFDPKTKEPIIPHDEEGYHAWSHLAERKCGNPTGLPSLRRAFDGTKYEKEILRLKKDFMQPHADRQALNKRYIDLMNRLVTEFKTTGPSGILVDLQEGYYYWGKLSLLKSADRAKMAAAPPEANYFLTVRNKRNETNVIRIAYTTDSKLKSVFVEDPDEPVTDNLTRSLYDFFTPMDSRFYTTPQLLPFLPGPEKPGTRKPDEKKPAEKKPAEKGPGTR